MTTGWPPGLLQDDERKLSRWFASRPGARYQLRKNMNTQPEALRLADLLETYPLNECDEEAAAELRRQHAELEATERQVEILSDELSRCSKLNREVLEALKEIVDAADGDGWNQLDASFSKARAAIAKATGEQK